MTTPLTDAEMIDARTRAEHEAEQYGYTVWVRLLVRLNLAEAVLRSATPIEVLVGDDGEKDELIVVSGAGIDLWHQAVEGW